MANDPQQARHFDEDAISAILHRASELQGQGPDARMTGLTEAELGRIASEAGIDPRHVSTAIAERDMRAALERPDLWGGPFSLTLDRVVAGQLNESTWEDVLSEIRAAFHEVGHSVQRGDVWEWSQGRQTQSGPQTYITATPEGCNTRLRIVWNEPIVAVPSYVLAGTLGLVLIPVIFESLGLVSFTGAALYLSLIAMLYTLARWTVVRTVRKKKANVQQLMLKLEHVLSAGESDEHALLTEEPLASALPTEERLHIDLTDSTTDAMPPTAQAVKRNQRSKA